MRTQVLAALAAGGALLGGCHRMPVPEMAVERNPELTRATEQHPLDVAGPRVDPRTRTGGTEVAGTPADQAEGRDAVSLRSREPERQRSGDLVPRLRDEERGVGGSGFEGDAGGEVDVDLDEPR